jgi:glycosyltransferase involved in cell wall biosynthesis
MDMATAALLRRRQYDVAIVGLYSGRAFLWGEAMSALLRKLGCPLVRSMHGGALPEFAARHSNRVTNTLRKAAVVTAPSRYLAERMRPYRDDVVIVPNPVDIGRYAFRVRSSIKPRLIWLRAFHQIYNPELAVSVAATLRGRYPDLALTMVGPDKGDGTWQRTAQAGADTLARGNFLMPGGVANTDVPQWLDRGDIFINTTNVDNTPVSVIEAMACGLPVVSTNVGGLPYLLTDGVDALLVPPGDAKAMAAGVQRVLTEPGLAESLSRNGRAKAEGFDWLHVLPSWRTVLDAIR